MEKSIFVRGLLALALACGLHHASAQTLPAPKGAVVLTVSGKVGNTNQAGQALLDMAMIEALPQQSFSTQTPWHKSPIVFSGPLLRDVFKLLKVDGDTIRATALNDYQVRIPMEDARRFDMVLAWRMNGEPMPVRTHGPLFIVYPFDSSPQLRSVRYYERSIWQLKALEIE